MIKVIITRRASDETIESFSVKGHADFAESGKDIVCAGVSAVTIGTINAVEELLGIAPDTEMKSGWLTACFPDGLPQEQEEKLQLLLEAMVVTLKSIEQSYGSYITVKNKLGKGGRQTC
ncbi:Predicted ribosomal protein [Chlamydia abortus]|uniref:ribosomal-processing cysteine protease Prp n=1 Tax=unclassified Paenibacillus TaxID=185978 RepID=UPI000A27CD94|nr:ribosomal-processing cysteine protease Prp [Paenibacillus sp. 32O-W]SHE09837.1 Predicted ribosomal protein [Chlamydia abortus]